VLAEISAFAHFSPLRKASVMALPFLPYFVDNILRTHVKKQRFIRVPVAANCQSVHAQLLQKYSGGREGTNR
jgi:hypothetical protein